jgi:hypothetical protein
MMLRELAAPTRPIPNAMRYDVEVAGRPAAVPPHIDR